MKNRLATAENTLKDAIRDKEIAIDESERRFRTELENLRRESQKELEARIFRHNEEERDLRRRLDSDIKRLRIEADQKDREFVRLLAETNEERNLRRRLDRELKDERAIRQQQEANQASLEHAIDIERLRIEAGQKDREFARLLAETNEAKRETATISKWAASGRKVAQLF